MQRTSPTERQVLIGAVSFPIPLLDRVEAYADKQKLSRVEAIRRLCEKALESA